MGPVFRRKTFEGDPKGLLGHPHYVYFISLLLLLWIIFRTFSLKMVILFRMYSLYIGADSTYFSSNTLFDTANTFVRSGGKVLYIDEVHKYPEWSKEVKMIYDYLPDLKIVVTGSSILDIIRGTDADLRRRAISYNMEGLSFREYLNFSLGLKIDPVSLEQIIAGNAVLPPEIKHPSSVPCL